MSISIDYTNWPDRFPWFLRPLVWLTLCVMALPFGIMILTWICVATAVTNYFNERTFAIRLRAQGRSTTIRQLEKRLGSISSTHGTLIIERPFPSWGITRAWWCPNKFSNERSYAAIYPNQLSPDTGNALLLQSWNGKNIVPKFKRKFSSVAVIYVSAPA